MFKDISEYYYYFLTLILKSEHFPSMLTNHFWEVVLKMQFLENAGLKKGILTYESNQYSKYGCFMMNDYSSLHLHLLSISPWQMLSDYLTFPLLGWSRVKEIVFIKLLIDPRDITKRWLDLLVLGAQPWDKFNTRMMLPQLLDFSLILSLFSSPGGCWSFDSY